MTTAVFDTLKASDTLKAAGIEAKQAAAIVHTMAAAFEDTVATKTDLDKLESSVKTDMANLKAELKAEIVEVKQDIAEVKGELKEDIAEVKAELKATATKADLVEVKADTFKVAIGVVIAIILANSTMTIALIRFLS